MRKAKSCQQCRIKKQKCLLIEGQNACVQCQKTGADCSIGKTSLRPRGAAPLVAKGATSGERQPALRLSEEITTKLVQSYLDFIHDRPHSMFHKATLWRDIREKKISLGLLYSICSLGSRFAQDPETQQLGPRLTAESKRILQADFENICLPNIQTAILLANLCSADLEIASEALYFGTQPAFQDIMVPSS